MWKKVITLFLVVAALLSFTACNGGAPSVSAQEIIDGAIGAADNLTSHRFESSMSMEASGEEDGAPVDAALAEGQVAVLIAQVVGQVGVGEIGADPAEKLLGVAVQVRVAVVEAEADGRAVDETEELEKLLGCEDL